MTDARLDRATCRHGGPDVRLRFLGKESTPTNSPTLYAADHDAYVVQGWIINDVDVLARNPVDENETVVEVPPALLKHLSLDGLVGDVGNVIDPITDTMPNGNYVIRGKRVTDADTLSQMDIPDHETCVLVGRTAVVALLA